MRNSIGDDGKSGPTLVSWNVTSRCNLRCAHCYMDAGDGGGALELSTSEAKMLVDQVNRAGSPVLILSGGEPLLRDDLFEIAEYGTQQGLRMAIGTNGTLIDDRTAVRLAGAGIRKAAISLDSADPGVHDRFRGVTGAWERAVAGIEACRDAGIPVQVHTTVTLQNHRDLEGIAISGRASGCMTSSSSSSSPRGGERRSSTSPRRCTSP